MRHARSGMRAGAPLPILLLTSLVLCAEARAGAPALVDRLLLSADVPLAPGGSNAGAAAVLHADGAGDIVSVETLPAAVRANRANLVALAARLSGPALERWLVLDGAFAPAASAAVPAGRPFRCLDAACTAVERLPLPPIADGVGVAALAFDIDGMVLLALDAAGTIGATALPAGAVLRCDAATCALVAGAETFPDGARVDTLEVLVDGRWLVGFDSGGSVAGLAFRDEDLLLHDPLVGSWGAAFALRDVEAAWEAANLDAVAVPLAPDALFSDGFEGS